jgi:hypothetical protein
MRSGLMQRRYGASRSSAPRHLVAVQRIAVDEQRGGPSASFDVHDPAISQLREAARVAEGGGIQLDGNKSGDRGGAGDGSGRPAAAHRRGCESARRMRQEIASSHAIASVQLIATD